MLAPLWLGKDAWNSYENWLRALGFFPCGGYPYMFTTFPETLVLKSAWYGAAEFVRGALTTYPSGFTSRGQRHLYLPNSPT